MQLKSGYFCRVERWNPNANTEFVTYLVHPLTNWRITMDYIDTLIAYEQGDLDDDQTIDFFQELINTGVCWSLQGSYGRTARALIDAGYCSAA